MGLFYFRNFVVSVCCEKKLGRTKFKFAPLSVVSHHRKINLNCFPPKGTTSYPRRVESSRVNLFTAAGIA